MSELLDFDEIYAGDPGAKQHARLGALALRIDEACTRISDEGAKVLLGTLRDTLDILWRADYVPNESALEAISVQVDKAIAVEKKIEIASRPLAATNRAAYLQHVRVRIAKDFVVLRRSTAEDLFAAEGAFDELEDILEEEADKIQ
ncbi:MAG: hypothetical protein COA73_05400 [Candidatus Hydrogenedentota bacterium]|nr:MAG: hypothetical protein COA73_05400 [Candidatus Hydrogenedentota bacterium]